MTEYDSRIIQKYSDRLYSYARQIELGYPLLAALVGAGITLILWKQFAIQTLYGAIGTSALTLIVWAIAREHAFQLRLKAQTALCQVRIEENTRPSLKHHAEPSRGDKSEVDA